MKIGITVLALLAPSFVLAGNYSIKLSAAEDAIFSRAKSDFNARVCESVALPSNCTDAQAQAAGASESLYANGKPGDEDYLEDLLKERIAGLDQYHDNVDEENANAARKAANPGQRQAACVAYGKGPDCK